MKQLLWIGDAGCPSGFARATHAILETLRQHYAVTVLGLNYRGDPHSYPYPLYAAAAEGDAFGIGRLIWMCDLVKPDVIVIQNDGWNVPYYMQRLRAFPEYAQVPVVVACAVDGKNFNGAWLKGVAHTVFWTQFALDEARAGGYEGPATVIPLGVDTAQYYPEDRLTARRRLRLPEALDTAFIVGNVNRNQPRKRWDLTVKYFAEWVTSRHVEDAYLYLHTAPTGDTGCDVKQLARYYGVLEHLILMEPPTFYGSSEDTMRDTYSCFDAQLSTTQGEGFGLTTFEGMACGVPQIVPTWSALGELCGTAALQVPCTSTCIGPPYVNVIGGVPDEAACVDALDALYRSPGLRDWYRHLGGARVREARFQWAQIGQRYVDTLRGLWDEPLSEAVWQDLGRPQEVTQ